jgi:rare lipoprotein A
MCVTGRPIHAGFALLALAMFSAVGCGHRVAHAKVPIAPARIGATETGFASWYGIPYHGRRAASGEIYDMEKLTAAHRKLPFQTWVEVTNLANGKHVDVRINDRGPFARGRIIDLSQAAARDVDMLGPGTVRVRLKVIAPPLEESPGATGTAIVSTKAGSTPATAPAPPAPAAIVSAAAIVPAGPIVPATPAVPAASVVPMDWYVVQAGAFADRNRAESLRATLEEMYADARVVAGSRNLWRVVVGRQMTLDQASELAVRVRKHMGAALVVPEPEQHAPSEPTIPQ